jgi:hypothetical protein
MGKIWGVWCKGVQSLMMGDLKQINILSLRSLIVVASLPLDYKEILESTSWCIHQVLNSFKMD